MKTNKYFMLAALAMFSVACSLEEVNVDIPAEDADVNITYINAVGGEENAEEAVKSTVSDNANFAWTNGDKIAVYADGGYKISDELASATGSNNVVFAFSGDQTFDLSTRSNFAVFPANLVTDSFGDIYTSDMTKDALLINLPASYNLSDVNGNNSPTPMIADNTGKDLKFKSICALLRFTLVNVPKQTDYITCDFNGKKVCGEHLLTDVVAGETAVVAADTEEMDDIITICNDGVFNTFQKNIVVNVPVPTGKYTDVTITTWEGDPWDGGFKINAITMSVNKTVNAEGTGYEPWTAGRLSSRKRTVYLPVFTAQVNIGIGAGVKVVFSPGNLTAEIENLPEYGAEKNIAGTATNWCFAENQYDAVINSGDNDGNIFASKSQGKKVDLFNWYGASATNPAYTAADTQDLKYGLLYPSASCYTDAAKKTWDYWVGRDSGTTFILADWGELEIGGGKDICGYDVTYPAGTWRLPYPAKHNGSTDGTTEWARLLTSRKYLGTYNNNMVIDYCWAKVTLKDGENVVTYGMVIFPDHYDQNEPGTIPAGMPVIKNANNVATSVYADNVITLADWAKLESKGCVFLPAAGYRYKTSGVVADRNGDGIYWTNYANNSSANINAIVMGFSDTNVSPSNFGSSPTLQTAKSFARYQGASVRLIRQVN